MAPSEAWPVRYLKDDSWRKELCPDCGSRLFGLEAWRDHGSQHRWGSDWLAARVRAARPGEAVRINPGLLCEPSTTLVVQTVEDAAWKAGIPA